MPHTIVARDGSWTTGTLGPTQITTLTFDKPGHYLYFTREYPWSYGELIVVPATTSAGASPTTPSAGSDQVTFGKSVYAVSCAACHGESLTGREPAPALVGRGFLARWAAHDALALFDRVRTTMPPAAPGMLADDGYAAIVSYLLHVNDIPAPVPLDRQTMKGLAVTARTK